MFSKIELMYSYHQLRIQIEGIHKTTFRTRNTHYKFRVMFYWLINDLITLIDLMNCIFSPLLDSFMIVFMMISFFIQGIRRSMNNFKGCDLHFEKA